jgi:hypothetical protein
VCGREEDYLTEVANYNKRQSQSQNPHSRFSEKSAPEKKKETFSLERTLEFQKETNFEKNTSRDNFILKT